LSSTSVEHYGQTLDADSIEAAVHRALAGQAMVPRPLYPMDGGQYVTELWDKIKGTALEPAVRRALTEALADDDPEQRPALAAVTEARPEAVAGHDVYASFARAAAQDPSAAVQLAQTVARQILAGETSYSPMLRHHTDDPSLREALASVMVIHDHAWFLEQAPAWLDGEFGAVLGLLSATCGSLSLGELRTLRTELEALALTDEARDLVGAYVDDVQGQPSFAARGEGVRW
jgi:hypothetical protein